MIGSLPQAKSLGFFLLVHFRFDQVADKAVQAFALTGGKVFDDLPLALLDDDVDAVIGLFVISGSCFSLGIVILLALRALTSAFILT